MGCAGSTEAGGAAAAPKSGGSQPKPKPKAKPSEGPTPTAASVKYGARQEGGPPREVICHICGKNFLVHSIDNHIPRCEQLWKDRQETLPKSQRKPLPVLPKKAEKMKLEQRNEVAMQVYNDHALEKCPFCSRTFLPEKLEKHGPSCARSHGEDWPPKKEKAGPTKYATGEAKNTVICHICGRKYTTHSIDIHVPQCEDLWQKRQAKRPKSKQKPVPQLPKKAQNMKDLEKRNAIAMKTFEQCSLEACKHCGRTFQPDRLPVHQRACSKNPGPKGI